MKLPRSKLRYRYKTTPFSHQKKALEKLRRLNWTGALLMEMGTGKTKVAIDAVGIGFHNFGAKRVVVVAPLSVLAVWPRQIRQHSPVGARIFVLDGPVRDRFKVLRLLVREHVRGTEPTDRVTWVIINYEGLWRKDNKFAIEDLLRAWEPDTLIFDESHRIKNQASKQSKAAARIAEKARFRMLLSGTPITKAPLDIFGQFRAMDPEVFGTNWYAFKFTYGVWGGFKKFQLRGFRKLAELSQRVRDHSYRVRKKDCLDLPPKVYVDVPVTLSPSSMKIYREMADDMIAEIEETHATAAIVLVKLVRLSQITSGFIKDVEGKVRVFDSNKLNTCMDLVGDMVQEGHKVVIFVRFIQDIERLSERLDNEGIGYRILSGSVPVRKRDSFIQEFQTQPNVKVFIAQIQAGSLGIELTAADVVIYYSVNYNAADFWQSQDRVHRQGQTKKVTYYRLIVPHTIDHITFKVLDMKGKVANAVLYDPRTLLE